MLRLRSPSTSSTLCIENGMILVPRQWWPSVASSMNASCPAIASRAAAGSGRGARPDLPVEQEVPALVEQPPLHLGREERHSLGEPGRADDQVGRERAAVAELGERPAVVGVQPGDGPVAAHGDAAVGDALEETLSGEPDRAADDVL